MAIEIGSYAFNGPFHSASELLPSSGVYVILGKTGDMLWHVVDVGVSGNIQDRVANHDRKQCWKQTGFQAFSVAVFFAPERERVRIEQELRAQFQPPCSER